MDIGPIDPNITSLEIARKTTKGSRGVYVEFIEGMGQDLGKLLRGKVNDKGVDSVSILDALHEIRNDEDKRIILENMAGILKPEGTFVFNSAFTTEAIRNSPREWAKWKITAMDILGRKRNKEVPTLPIHSPEKYREMIRNAGLEVVHEATKVVNLTKRALGAIAMYPEFVRGVFEDMQDQDKFSLQQKSSALRQALTENNVSFLPRIWFEVIARKPTGSTVLFSAV